MKLRYRLLLVTLVSLVASGILADAATSNYLRVMSWNLRHEGWQGETDYRADAQQIWQIFGSTSTSPNGCDVVFLQEVMSKEVPANLVTDLTAVSGFQWSYVVTALVGRTTYKECYAMVYRTDRVSVVDAHLWVDVGDKFEREPLVVKLRDKVTSADYTFIDWHAVFGTTAQRKAEIVEIANVFRSVQDADATDQDVILLGDHNADATSTWWTTLTTTITPAVTTTLNELTTLNASGVYASAYDHFWMQRSYVKEYSNSGRDYVADTVPYYSTLSDHAPVWLKLYSTGDTD